MKKFLFFLFIVITNKTALAQNVGIGTATPNASAQLDVTSISKGILIPRMTGAQRNAIVGPANGLIVYQTNTEILPPSSPGFYLHESGGWKRMARVDEISGGTSTWTVSGTNQYSNVSGSVAVGTSAPHASALLDISSISKGVLMPRMTTSQRFAIAGPTNGLLVYDMDKDEFYYYNGSGWIAVINGEYWSRPITNRSRIANTADSVGIGTSAPTEKLDVNGRIRVRDNLVADAAAIISGNVGAGSISTGGTLTVLGNSAFGSDVTVNGDINISNSAATLQLKNAGVNKGFFQLSGDDLRLGTNGGNTLGDVYMRLDGNNRFKFEKNGRLTLLADANPTIYFATAGVNQAFLQLQGQDLNISATNNKVRINNSLYIDDATNRVGIGTSTPTEKLHVSGNALITGTSVFNGSVTMQAPVTINAPVNVYDNVSAGSLELTGGLAENSGIVAIGTDSYAAGYNAIAIGTEAMVQTADNSIVIGNEVGSACDGCMVLADGGFNRNFISFGSTGDIDKMFMFFKNGYELYTGIGTGVKMGNGDNSWSSISDSTKKENYLSGNGNVVLQKIANMKLGSWNYKVQDKTRRHYGPMAQEFFAAFGNDGIGKIGNDTTIATADIDGVMMIAIQALEKRTQRIEQLQTENTTLIQQQQAINKEMEDLKKRLQKLETALSGR